MKLLFKHISLFFTKIINIFKSDIDILYQNLSKNNSHAFNRDDTRKWIETKVENIDISDDDKIKLRKWNIYINPNNSQRRKQAVFITKDIIRLGKDRVYGKRLINDDTEYKHYIVIIKKK